MEQILIVLAIVAVLAALAWFQYRLSGRRLWNPLWMAFTVTALAALCVVSGLIGYNLSRHSRFIAGTSWSPNVIWWEVTAGLALVPMAAYFWRKGLRGVESVQH